MNRVLVSLESKGDGPQQGGPPLVDVIDDVAAARVVVFVGRKPRLDAALSSVCMCVYMCVCVCMHVCMFVCMSVCCLSVCMYVCMYVCLYVYVYVSRPQQHLRAAFMRAVPSVCWRW